MLVGRIGYYKHPLCILWKKKKKKNMSKRQHKRDNYGCVGGSGRGTGKEKHN